MLKILGCTNLIRPKKDKNKFGGNSKDEIDNKNVVNDNKVGNNKIAKKKFPKNI